MNNLPYLFDYISIRELILASLIIILIILDFFRWRSSVKKNKKLRKEIEAFSEAEAVMKKKIKGLEYENNKYVSTANIFSNDNTLLKNKIALIEDSIKEKDETILSQNKENVSLAEISRTLGNTITTLELRLAEENKPSIKVYAKRTGTKRTSKDSRKKSKR